MSPAEFAVEMRKIAELKGDTEASHGNADDLLCKALTALGYGEGVKLFEDMDKWYA